MFVFDYKDITIHPIPVPQSELGSGRQVPCQPEGIRLEACWLDR